MSVFWTGHRHFARTPLLACYRNLSLSHRSRRISFPRARGEDLLIGRPVICFELNRPWVILCSKQHHTISEEALECCLEHLIPCLELLAALLKFLDLVVKAIDSQTLPLSVGSLAMIDSVSSGLGETVCFDIRCPILSFTFRDSPIVRGVHGRPARAGHRR